MHRVYLWEKIRAVEQHLVSLGMGTCVRLPSVGCGPHTSTLGVIHIQHTSAPSTRATPSDGGLNGLFLNQWRLS